jgi:phosphotransferase system  glucose/maltose/N-acetylglucosamine-specific IIC component
MYVHIIYYISKYVKVIIIIIIIIIITLLLLIIIIMDRLCGLSSGQSSWLQIQGSRVRLPGTTKKK